MRPILLTFILVIFTASSAQGVSSVNVPLDNWVYPALEKLDGFGLLRSDLQGMRPFTRMEVARLVDEALTVQQQRGKALPSLAAYYLDRFKREYAEELGGYGWGERRSIETFIKPVDEAEVRYIYSEGEPRVFVNLGRGQQQYPKASARIAGFEGTPLVYNHEGLLYGEASNSTLQFSSSFQLMNVFSAYMQPIFVARENKGRVLTFGTFNQSTPEDLADFDRIDVDFLKGYVKCSPWNLELEAGRDSMWWGHGRHGELVLTNNASPFDMIKLSNPNPALLPWYFSYLGPFKFTYFMSVLHGESLVKDPWMTGLRVNFKPLPILEIGFMNTFLYNGKGQPKLSFLDFIASLTGIGFSEANRVNQISGIDFRIQLPFLRNAEIYGEYSGDDSGGFEYPEEYLGLGDIGYMIGIYFPRLTDDGRSDLRLELANNSHRVDSTPGMWYGHGIYPYTHDGLIMGHHMGPDALDLFVRTTRHVRDDLVVGLDYDYMARGLTLSTTEERVNQVGADATYQVDLCGSHMITFGFRYAFEAVSNYNLQQGEDRRNHLFMSTLKIQF